MWRFILNKVPGFSPGNDDGRVGHEKGPAHRCAGPVSVFSSARNQALMVVVSTFTPGPMVDESEMRLM